MQLRPATLEDLDLLRHWDSQPHVAAAGGADGWYDWPKELAGPQPWHELLIAVERGRPVGFLEITDPSREPTQYWGPQPGHVRALDIWIGEAGDLGRGLGTAMMRLVLARCFADPGVTAVLVDPLATNTRAQAFYARFGFRPVEQRVFELEECAVMRLERVDWQRRGGS